VVVVVVVEDLVVAEDAVPGTAALAPQPAPNRQLRASTAPTLSRAGVAAFLDRNSGTS